MTKTEQKLLVDPVQKIIRKNRQYISNFNLWLITLGEFVQFFFFFLLFSNCVMIGDHLSNAGYSG